MFCPYLWVRSNISVSLSGIAYVRRLSNERGEETFNAVSDGRSRNFSDFCLRLSVVLAARRMWLAWSSKPAVSYLFDVSELRSERCLESAYGVSFSVQNRAATDNEKTKTSSRCRRYNRGGGIDVADDKKVEGSCVEIKASAEAFG